MCGIDVTVEADVANAELERIAAENGGEFVVASVVKDAKRKKSPLHNEFEWSDQKAAELQRESRAAELSRWLVVVYEEDGKDTPPVRRFAGVRRGSNKAYAPTEDVMKDPDRRAVMLQEALSRLMSWRVQYRQLNELAIVFRAQDKLIEELAKK